MSQTSRTKTSVPSLISICPISIHPFSKTVFRTLATLPNAEREYKDLSSGTDKQSTGDHNVRDTKAVNDGKSLVTTDDVSADSQKRQLSTASSPSEAELEKKDDKDEYMVRWWDEEGGEVLIKKPRQNSTMVFSPSIQKYVEVPYESWTGSPLKDYQNMHRQEKVKNITDERDSKVQGAFLMFKKKDVDMMVDHYKKEQVKIDTVPAYVKAPIFTFLTVTVWAFVFVNVFDLW